MEIITIYPRGFGSNCYALTEDGVHAIVVDPAQARIEGELIKRGLKATAVLLTHCHFDHVNGAAALQACGAKVYCSAAERLVYDTLNEQFETWNIPQNPFRIDGRLEDGEELDFGAIKVKMLSTPGHTEGSCCYLVTAKDGTMSLFTGDTLFLGSVGRTDLKTGNITKLRASLRKLMDLEGDYPVYAGHGEETTLQHERDTNPFMRDA